MTVQAHLSVVPVPRLGAPDASTRVLGAARWLFLHGLAVLAGAILLGIAEALAVWMAAVIVAVGLLVTAAVMGLIGVITRTAARRHH